MKKRQRLIIRILKKIIRIINRFLWEHKEYMPKEICSNKTNVKKLKKLPKKKVIKKKPTVRKKRTAKVEIKVGTKNAKKKTIRKGRPKNIKGKKKN